jgi:hypothetical protein
MDSDSRLIFVNILFSTLLEIIFTGYIKQGRGQNETGLPGKEISHEIISYSDSIIINPEEPYCFLLQFQNDPEYQFKLWFPELAIFDRDSIRASIEKDYSLIILTSWTGPVIPARFTVRNLIFSSFLFNIISRESFTVVHDSSSDPFI